MKRNDTLRRALALALTAVMLVSAVSCGRETEEEEERRSARATSMYLRKTEGTVTVEDDDGQDLKPQKDMGLYSGYQVGTENSSYAWIDLDKTKITKLDEDSEVEIKRKKDDLELTVRRGALFFHVTRPLDEDESLNIRTSTMVVGIRGTCGWVRVESERELNVYILEGTVECSVTGSDGKITSTTVTAGEKARILREEEAVSIQVERMEREEVPTFVLVELEGDEDLLQTVQSASGLDLGGGTGGGGPANDFRMEDLAYVAYNGDLSQCAMTPQMAASFAAMLQRAMDQVVGPGQNGGEPFCWAALFDAGDGIPALWVSLGSCTSSDPGSHVRQRDILYQWVELAGACEEVPRVEGDYFLTRQGLLVKYTAANPARGSYTRTRLCRVEKGLITTLLSDYTAEEFLLPQAVRPTQQDLQELAQWCDSPNKDSFDYESFEEKLQAAEGTGVWQIGAMNGRLQTVDDLHYQWDYWMDAEVLLGNAAGEDGGSWSWYGTWTEGADMLAALTGRGLSQPDSGTDDAPSAPARRRTTSVYDPETLIRRTGLDVGEMNLELYYEIPVFPETSGGYRFINQFFQDMEDAYFAQGGEADGMIELRQMTDLSDTFASTYEAAIHTNDARLVSVTHLNYSHAGGPHPNTYLACYTFRADTGEILTLRDLIDGTDEEIKTLIADTLEPEYQLESTERESVLSYSVENIHFYVEDGSVWVYFNPYEISYYARGDFLVRLPVPLQDLG